jgi:hypothetical protein
MKIVAIVAPRVEAPNLATAVSPRQFDAVDEFAAAVSVAAQVPVQVIEGGVADAPADAFILLFDAGDLAAHPDAARRSILINADRSNVLKKLEELELAGAVEKQRYFRWRTARDQEDGGGLFGRKPAAAAVGASLLPGPFQTQHYGLLGRSAHRDLPSLVAAYLAALSD